VENSEQGGKSLTEKLNESISAMLDDEAEEFEVRRVLGEIAGNFELKSTWSRYHTISSILKREGRSDLDKLALEDVSHDDVGPSTSPKTSASRTLKGKRLLGRETLIAAFAAAIVVLAIIITINDERTKQVELTDTLVARVSTATDERLPDESDIRRAEAYLIRHAQHVSLNSSATPIPFVKVIAHEAER
tara:strand:+ start:84 stop:653 length:570 start_codon:yes stop_codon:yes gene_type:complete